MNLGGQNIFKPWHLFPLLPFFGPVIAQSWSGSELLSEQGIQSGGVW